MTRTYRELEAAVEADAFDVHQPDVVLAAGMSERPTARRARAGEGPLVQPAHLDERDRAAGEPPRRGGRRRRAVPRVPVRPAGLDPGAPRRLPRRADPAGRGRDPAGAGGARDRRRPRRGRDPAVRGVTGRRRERGAASAPRTGSRGRPRSTPRTEAFIDGRFVPAASGETFADVAGRDGSTIADVADGRRRGRRPGRRRGAGRRSTTGAGPTARRPTASGSCSRFAERIRGRRATSSPCSSRSTSASRSATRSRSTSRRAAKTIQWYAETIDKVYGEVGPTGPDALSLVTREPIGVVAAIVPWNYPLIITAWKIGAALATGNSVVLKPASQSPLTALRLAELAAEAGLPDGVLNVVPGPGAVVGPALARHPGVDKITFTGSTEVGKSLLRAVGETDVKAITLELGGKSPQVVLADVGDLEAAASAIGWGIFYNSGQTCNAGSRLIVHRSVREELVERIAALGRTARAGRAARSGDAARRDRRRAPAREGARLRRARAGGGRAGRGRRRAGPRGERRLLRPADDPRRRLERRGASPARRSSGRS